MHASSPSHKSDVYSISRPVRFVSSSSYIYFLGGKGDGLGAYFWLLFARKEFFVFIVIVKDNGADRVEKKRGGTRTGSKYRKTIE